ncbi:MAG: PhzF family phenazine biosynthesis protein [Candidatus Eisenbacteria bacterium]|jgi:PhzF family phenazine biosynthesis protein|nr:PhzF family phenazine biosynthesis protein [Candidatus Eisenbacteria bacterium]
MALKIFQVDAFTSEPFKGNPAGVCLLDGPYDDEFRQNVAREMNLSETAFPLREDEGFRLRWFTPAVEVALCGHATLATSHVLWEEGIVPLQTPIRYFTKSGELRAARRDGLIELDFPVKLEQTVEAPESLIRAMGVMPRYVGRNQFDYLFLLDNEATVRKVSPDFRLLRGAGARGIMVTAPSDSSEFDFVSRFFAPGAGIDEDPVTGSAHCCLGPFWAARLGKTELRAYQASARGGELLVRVAGDRVLLAGHAVTVLRGELVA